MVNKLGMQHPIENHEWKEEVTENVESIYNVITAVYEQSKTCALPPKKIYSIQQQQSRRRSEVKHSPKRTR